MNEFIMITKLFCRLVDLFHLLNLTHLSPTPPKPTKTIQNKPTTVAVGILLSTARRTGVWVDAFGQPAIPLSCREKVVTTTETSTTSASEIRWLLTDDGEKIR